MNLEKTVKTLIDALVAIVMIVLIYQELATPSGEGSGWPAVIVAMAFLALAGWFIKKVIGPITRAADGLFEGEENAKTK